MARKPKAKANNNPRPPVLEWMMSGLGLLLTLIVLVLILKEAFSPIEPAALTLRLEGSRPVADGWIAEVEVENTGDTTAAAVEIEGRLGAETAAVSLDYVPAGGTETVVLGFSADPRSGLSLRTLGWSEP